MGGPSRHQCGPSRHPRPLGGRLCRKRGVQRAGGGGLSHIFDRPSGPIPGGSRTGGRLCARAGLATATGLTPPSASHRQARARGLASGAPLGGRVARPAKCLYSSSLAARDNAANLCPRCAVPCPARLGPSWNPANAGLPTGGVALTTQDRVPGGLVRALTWVKAPNITDSGPYGQASVAERPVALPPDTGRGVASCRNLASLRGYVRGVKRR
jgi:hypothetical protein